VLCFPDILKLLFRLRFSRRCRLEERIIAKNCVAAVLIKRFTVFDLPRYNIGTVEPFVFTRPREIVGYTYFICRKPENKLNIAIGY